MAFPVWSATALPRGPATGNNGGSASGEPTIKTGSGPGDFPAGDSKKNAGDSVRRVEECYELIEEFSGEHSVVELCELLGVARSGYYAWCVQGQSKQQRMNEELSRLIEKVFEENKGRYGSLRITAALRQQGQRCNHKRVERLMREKGLQARPRKGWRPRTTDSKHTNPIAPNLLLGREKPKAVNEIWLEDMTYLRTAEGWLYLAGVLDLYSRKIVGWSMQESLETSLPLAALLMALKQRGQPRKVIHHSDRGSQYASEEYRGVLVANDLIPSMSRKGNCYDNASMESFWSSLKVELQEERLDRLPNEAVKQVVFEYIESYYNRKRLHSSLNYQSPVAFESKQS